MTFWRKSFLRHVPDYWVFLESIETDLEEARFSSGVDGAQQFVASSCSNNMNHDTIRVESDVASYSLTLAVAINQGAECQLHAEAPWL